MTNLLDKALEDLGLKYDDLNVAERETYRQKSFQAKTLTIPDLIDNVRVMKDSVALQLSDTPDMEENQDTNCKLKARLKNYIVLEAFLTSPEKAERALKQSLEGVNKK